MMKRRIGNTWILAAFAFVSLAATAFAQVVHAPVHVTPGPTALHSPIAMPTLLAPGALPTNKPGTKHNSMYIDRPLRAGTKVPLYKLPHRPGKTYRNTVAPVQDGTHRHFRPMAESGATAVLTADPTTCTNAGTVGDLFNINCKLTMVGTNMALYSSTDTYQDYVLFPNSQTATALCSSYVGSGTDPGCQVTLSVQGTYMFAVYDITQQAFAAAVYANAGQVFNIQVFQDSFHTEPSYQFDTVYSPAAYVYLQNVAPSDRYVMYVMSTGVNAYCVYMSPAGSAIPPPSPRPTGAPSSLVCNPTVPTGNQAPGGNLSVQWTFGAQLEAGTYSVIVYDQTAGLTLGQVQVSLTTGSTSILTVGSPPPLALAPSPAPSAGNPPSSTIFAWDSPTDSATGGIKATTQQVQSPGSFLWTISDPTGRVAASPQPTATGTTGPSSNLFNFANVTMQQPGEYPAPFWSLGFYQPSLKKTLSAQAIQIVGYHATTEFVINSTTPSIQMNFDAPACSGANYCVQADLKFTNDSNIIYNGQGDTISEIEFTTGDQAGLNAAFNPPGVGAHCRATAPTSCGTEMVFTSLQACNTAAGCAKTAIADTSGNLWDATDWCSSPTNANVVAGAYCVVQLRPENINSTLAAGASITISNMFWYAQGALTSWPCYDIPCTGTTAILPTHGLAWSVVSNAAAPVAWTPVTFGSNVSTDTIAGTAQFDYVGSGASPPPLVAQAIPPTVPWTEAHLFQSHFTRAGYQNSTPFTAGARFNVASIKFTNNQTGGETIANAGGGLPMVAIGFPSYFTTSSIVVDPVAANTAKWTKVGCPSTFGSTFVCLEGVGANTTIASGASATVLLDLPNPVSSFTFSDMTMSAFSGGELLWFPLTAIASAAEPTIDGSQTIDSLGIGAYSLNSSLMSAAFLPSTVGTNVTPLPLTISVQNTSTSADPNPDAIDEIVIEEQGLTPTASYVVSGTPTASTSKGFTWNWLGTVASTHPANTNDYYFGACPTGTSNWGNLTGGPPQPNGVAVPLTGGTSYPLMGTCGTQTHALQPGDTATLNMSLVGNITTGTTVTFYMYAHGANGGGWSAPKPFTLTYNSESASAGFSNVGATPPPGAVAANTLPTILTSPNYFTYTVKNTSQSATKAHTILIQLPDVDINGLPAQNGSAQWSLITPIASTITLTTSPSGNVAAWGCSVNTNAAHTFNPVPGSTPGQIEVDCTNGIPTGDSLLVQFEAASPGIESDTYNFPSTVDGFASAQTWIGDQEVQESFAVGLTVVVDPANPGPGGSTPTNNKCTQCAYSGSTIDYGAITNGNAVLGTDVVRTTVFYKGATVARNWQLNVTASQNPACTGGAACNVATQPFELLTSVDATNSKTSCSAAGGTITGQLPSLTAIPTGGTTLNTAQGTETSCSPPPPYTGPYYDVINSIQVQIGTEQIPARFVTITYTLVP
jgi:hypothetical protein